jgi:hypothetical protein
MDLKFYPTPHLRVGDNDQLAFCFEAEKIKIRNRLTYISGGISAFLTTDKNEPAFREAEKVFSEFGLKPIVPHDLHTPEEQSRFDWCDFMLRDTPEELKCGLVAMLPGWEDSNGAVTEFMNAKIHGIPVVCSRTFKPIFMHELNTSKLFYKINQLLIKGDSKFINQLI